MDDSFSTYHPIINFGYFLVVLLFSMFFNHPVFLLISLISSVFYALVLKHIRRSLELNLLYMLPILLLIALMNPLFSHGGVTIIGYWWTGNPITLESIVYGAVMAIMFIEVIIWFACYNTIMTSDKFIYLFGRIIPALSLVFSMVLRFVPKFQNHLKIVSNGQRCIGRDASTGNFFQRARHGITILSIMVTWALENAIETSDSMVARGYGLKGRTSFSIFRFDSRDVVVFSIMVILLSYTCVGIGFGCAYASYNPAIKYCGFTGYSISVYLTWFGFCLLPIFIDGYEELKWRHLRSEI